MLRASEVILEFFDCLENLSTSVERCTNLFAEDGAFEFPYLPTLGMPGRYEGRPAIRGVLELITSRFSSFTLSKVEIHECKDPSEIFVEYHSDGFIDGSDRIYAQDYVSRMVVKDGKIKLLREYMNVISTARALLPDGLADVPQV